MGSDFRRGLRRKILAALCGALAVSLFGGGEALAVDPGQLIVHVDRPGVALSPTFYGLMTEEINHSYDGGLYGELIQNRIFGETSNAENCRASAGDPTWTDFTYTLKAQKLSGKEGFLVMFHVVDNDNFIWWNIGGWGNTHTALEKAENGTKSDLGPSTNMAVEANRW